MATITIPELGRIIIVESKARPSSESELDDMLAGEIARVTHKKQYRNKEVYEGVIDGKEAFMLQDAKELKKINSFRIARENIMFDEHYGAIIPDEHTEIIVYDLKTKDYEAKKQMLIFARKWRED